MSVKQGLITKISEELFSLGRVPEMNIKKIKKIFNHDFGNNYEYLYIYEGYYKGEFKPSKKEVHRLIWMKTKDVLSDVEKNPKRYAPVFLEVIKKIK